MCVLERRANADHEKSRKSTLHIFQMLPGNSRYIVFVDFASIISVSVVCQAMKEAKGKEGPYF